MKKSSKLRFRVEGIAKSIVRMGEKGLQNVSRTAPGASLRALGAVLASWRSPGGLLERFLEPLGAARKPLGALLKPLEAILAPIWSQLGGKLGQLGANIAPK